MTLGTPFYSIFDEIVIKGGQSMACKSYHQMTLAMDDGSCYSHNICRTTRYLTQYHQTAYCQGEMCTFKINRSGILGCLAY